MIEKKERKVMCQLGPYENDRPTFIVYHFKQLCKKLCPYVKNLVTYLVNASCCFKKKKNIQSSNSPSPTIKLSKKQFLKLCP